MSQNFSELCNEVKRATKFISNCEQCRPHYQRVLDYITSHPDQRDETAKALCGFVENGGYTEISLVQFLMESLKWPEVRSVAAARYEREGNMGHELKHLVDLYG